MSHAATLTESRATELFEEYQSDLHRRTDRLFAGLLGFQWIAGILFALWISPLAWSGSVSRTHLHVWAAILLGGVISLFPAFQSTGLPIAGLSILLGLDRIPDMFRTMTNVTGHMTSAVVVAALEDQK